MEDDYGRIVTIFPEFFPKGFFFEAKKAWAKCSLKIVLQFLQSLWIIYEMSIFNEKFFNLFWGCDIDCFFDMTAYISELKEGEEGLP